MKKILVIAPHPDDETLGCGGTLLKHRAEGNAIYWLIMTSIYTEHGFAPDAVARREKEVESVARAYGFKEVFNLGFPTAKLDTVNRGLIVQEIGRIVREVVTEIVYIPNRNDIHSDHTLTSDASLSALKTFRCESVKRVLSYEVLSETEFAPPFQSAAFIPNSFSDISQFLPDKISIVDMYHGELAEHPFPRSVTNIKAIATFRGATAGVKYAEAFMVLKERW